MLLASETLKIIIAVICIGFLIYLLAAVYFSNVSDKEKLEAEKVLNDFEDIYSSLNESNSPYSYYGVSPGGWKIFSYTDMDEKPNSCAGKNCICICDVSNLDLFNSQLKKCAEEGVCYITNLVEDNPDIFINKDGSTNVVLYKEGSWEGIRKI